MSLPCEEFDPGYIAQQLKEPASCFVGFARRLSYLGIVAMTTTN
jgi:hypothetical protein